MDVEKTMEFLLSQQAGHDQRLAQLEANVTRLATIAEKQIEAHDRLARETSTKINALADAQQRAEVEMAELRENMNALIRVVDGLVRRPPESA